MDEHFGFYSYRNVLFNWNLCRFGALRCIRHTREQLGEERPSLNWDDSAGLGAALPATKVQCYAQAGFAEVVSFRSVHHGAGYHHAADAESG
jgi:hypothetical protein